MKLRRKLAWISFACMFFALAGLALIPGASATSGVPAPSELRAGALLGLKGAAQPRSHSPIARDTAQFCVNAGGGCNAAACPGGEGGCQSNCCNGLVCLLYAGVAACRGGGADGR
ncbi:MAG: hypothetical protein Kow0032_03310 [Methyloligellaceae bacterium]